MADDLPTLGEVLGVVGWLLAVALAYLAGCAHGFKAGWFGLLEKQKENSHAAR